VRDYPAPAENNLFASSTDLQAGAAAAIRTMRQCSGMFPEKLTLDLAGTDEFSLATPSLPRTDP
jgi:hypothetical protein